MADPDGIVLVGMPTSGKSTVGRFVAERLGRRFVDTDELAERRAGMPAAAYIGRHGEAAYRTEEAKAVAEACGVRGAVVATGGGAPLDPLNRWALWHHGTVVWLDVAVDELRRRLSDDAVPRPTLQPYTDARLREVMAARAAVYRAADLRVDASPPPERVAAEIGTPPAMPAARRLLDAEFARHHPVGPPSGRLVMGTGITDCVPNGVRVVDARLAALESPMIGAGGPGPCLSVPAGERAKRMRVLERVLEWLSSERVERGTPIVAVGGGSIGDLAGTAAALYARGVPLAHVPTTWLAQADSAIGGKVAVDLRSAKNAVGAFWPPVAVVSDVTALRSLPVRARRDGMAETVKAALIGDPALWQLLEERGVGALRLDEAARYAAVERSARLKLDVCARDPFESGERRTLNLGHTIGHALEIESRYRLAHGSAVALGMRAVATIAASRGADPDLVPRLDDLLTRLGFGTRRRFDAPAVAAAMQGDKKRHRGRQRWILPMEIGRVTEADDVTEVEVDRALGAIAA